MNGKLEGIVTSRDYRVSRMDLNTKVSTFMTPINEMIVGGKETSLQEANDIIWDNKLNTLPIIDDEGRLLYMVFRKDYATHKEYPLELLDSKKTSRSRGLALIPATMLNVYRLWLMPVPMCFALILQRVILNGRN